MLNVSTLNMYKALAPLGVLVPFHRFRSIEGEQVNVECARHVSNGFPIAASVGLAWARCEAILPMVDIAFLELAHADTHQCHEMVKKIKKEFPRVTLVVGNVCTKHATKRLVDLGVDYCKVGIGPGSACTTRQITGVGLPQLSAILECAPHGNIIADGGIRNSGDIVKALAAGAKFVMVGSLLAGTNETDSLDTSTGWYNYGGSASDRVREETGMQRVGIVAEGVSTQVPPKGPARAVVESLIAGVRQGMSMVGARNLVELVDNAYFQIVSCTSLRESRAHILDRSK
jgi:IMP dehydrogenase